jgi:arabinan endo-1,5-alpha-L-arabinosidase
MKLQDIQIRDPFVLPVPTEQAYYLFGSTDKNIWDGTGTGFDCYRSTDLENWDGPIPAFRPEADFWGTTQFWAPEAHVWNERYYLVATFNAPGRRIRGSQLLVADRPQGPYRPNGEPFTPANWSCLDATLWTEPDASPWAVFSHEWLQVHDGALWARPLDSDLQSAGRPVFLFNASEAPWARPMNKTIPCFDPNRPYPCFVTDGPFLHRTAAGTLLMLWSSIGEFGYAMGISRSESGRITGPWIHQEQPIISDDGGHGMIFKGFDGRLRLTFHQPNDTPNERAVFLPIRETGDSIVIER